jgi:hypothetical protein
MHICSILKFYQCANKAHQSVNNRKQLQSIYRSVKGSFVIAQLNIVANRVMQSANSVVRGYISPMS